MNVIGARINELGKVVGGKVGDQTLREVCVHKFEPYPWDFMLIPKDRNIGAKAVEIGTAICKNENIGYGQPDRYTARQSIIANNGDISKAKGDLDCSEFVRDCYELQGIELPNTVTTATLQHIFEHTGLFNTDTEHCNDENYMIAGAIYCKAGHHTVIGAETATSQHESLVWTTTKGNVVIKDSAGNIIAETNSNEGLTVNLTNSTPDTLSVAYKDVNGFCSSDLVNMALIWRNATRSDFIYSDSALQKCIGTVSNGEGATINNWFSTLSYTRCTLATGLSGYVRAGVF